VVLSRLDAFRTAAGPRFIEINSDAPAGFGYGDRMADVFRELPSFRRFALRHPVAYEASSGPLVDAVLEIWSRRGDPASPTVAIVDFYDVRTRADQEILADEFAARAVKCVMADPRETEVRDGGLWAGPERIDLVYRRAVLAELLERETDVEDFLTAYRDGLVPFVNSFRCHLSEDKAFFALLGDDAFAHLMSPEERAFVDRVVPWTRKDRERLTLRDGREVDLVPARSRAPRTARAQALARVRRPLGGSSGTRPTPERGKRRCARAWSAPCGGPGARRDSRGGVPGGGRSRAAVRAAQGQHEPVLRGRRRRRRRHARLAQLRDQRQRGRRQRADVRVG
jgi:hypothetical protein